VEPTYAIWNAAHRAQEALTQAKNPDELLAGVFEATKWLERIIEELNFRGKKV
jgi:hypothetical protein